MIEYVLRGDEQALAVRRPGDRADRAVPRIGELPRLAIFEVAQHQHDAVAFVTGPRHRAIGEPLAIGRRSEEHTSELQSLMRISYAVFCLKKTKKNQTKQQN